MTQLKTVKKIVIHCSVSEFGDAKTIDAWHREKGWAGCGYHYVITNGVRVVARPYVEGDDGVIEVGRAEDTQGAHVRQRNHDSLGICLIGKHTFSGRQLFSALPELLARLLKKYKLNISDVMGHGELDSKKTCPNLDMNDLRRILSQEIEATERVSEGERTG